jgi:hypothetical protein
MTDEDIIRIGYAAEQILASEAFTIAMEDIERFNIECWADGKFKTSQEREEAYALVRGARTFRAKLNAMLDAMKLSKAQAERRVELRR